MSRTDKTGKERFESLRRPMAHACRPSASQVPGECMREETRTDRNMKVYSTRRLWERCKFDSIGVGVTDMPRALKVRLDRRRRRGPIKPRMRAACSGGALKVRLDLRGCHRHAALVALSSFSCVKRALGGAASSTRLGWGSLACRARGPIKPWTRAACTGSVASSTRSAWASPACCARGLHKPRMRAACSGECCKPDSVGVGITGTLRS
jgi:hypothetical protein